MHLAADELLDLDGREIHPARSWSIFRDQRARDIVAVVRAILAGMARCHAVAVAIKQHAGKEAGLARSSTALAAVLPASCS